MAPNDIPDSGETLARIDALPIVIRQAFEAGVQEAREYFDRMGEPIEPYLFANLARYRAVRYLRAHSQALVEYVQEQLNNNGIGLIFAGCYLRVWKAVHRFGEKTGEIPAAGHSLARQGFLAQHIQLSLFEGDNTFDDALRAVDLNLVVLWDTDRRHNLSELRLVMPKQGGILSTSAYWDIPIPNPILSMSADAETLGEANSDDDLADVIQLQVEWDSATGQSE